MGDADQAVRDIVKGASIVYTGLFIELIIAFVAQVVAARYLSVSGFGGLTTGTALLDLGSIVAGLGLSSGLTRYLPRVKEGQKRVLTVVVVAITAITSTVIGVLIVANAGFIAGDSFGDPKVETSILILGAVIAFATVLNVSIGGIRGRKRPRYRVYVKNLVHPVVRFGLVIAAVGLGLGQAGLAGAYAIPYLVSALLAVFFLYRSLPRSGYSIDTRLTAEVARYSLPFTITNVSSFIYRSIDIFLILHFLGSFAVGVYGVAYAATKFMGMFSTAFNYLGTPVASELEHGGNVEEVMVIFRSVIRWLVIGSVCVFIPLGIFSSEFISIIYDSKYASGGAALTLLAAGFAATNVLSIHSPILQALGHSKTLSFNSIAAAIVNIGLNLFLIPRHGIMGAAVATVLAFLLRDGLAAAQVWYHLGKTPLSWKGIGPAIFAIPFLIGVRALVAPAVPSSFLWLVSASGTLSALYGGAVLIVFGISNTELMVLRSAEERYGISLETIEPLLEFLSKR